MTSSSRFQWRTIFKGLDMRGIGRRLKCMSPNTNEAFSIGKSWKHKKPILNESRMNKQCIKEIWMGLEKNLWKKVADLIKRIRLRAYGKLGLHNNRPWDIESHNGVGWCYHAWGDRWRLHKCRNRLLNLLMHKPTFPWCRGLFLQSQIQQFELWNNIHIHILGLSDTISRHNSQLLFPLSLTSFSNILYPLHLNTHELLHKTYIKLLP